MTLRSQSKTVINARLFITNEKQLQMNSRAHATTKEKATAHDILAFVHHIACRGKEGRGKRTHVLAGGRCFGATYRVIDDLFGLLVHLVLAQRLQVRVETSVETLRLLGADVIEVKVNQSKRVCAEHRVDTGGIQLRHLCRTVSRHVTSTSP